MSYNPSIFRFAVEIGELAICKEIVEKFPDRINDSWEYYREIPLTVAARAGNIGVFAFLLAQPKVFLNVSLLLYY